MKDKKKQSMHVAALTLGIISSVAIGFWYISIPTGILAIVFGAKSAKRTGSKMAKAGLITGIIGIALTVLFYVGIIFIYLLGEL